MLDEAMAFYDKVKSSYPRSAAAAQAKDRVARIKQRKSGGTQASQPTSQSGTSYPTETLEQRLRRRKAATPPPNATVPGSQVKEF